jgi:hypothetical protein
MKLCGECGAPLKAVSLTGPPAPSYPEATGALKAREPQTAGCIRVTSEWRFVPRSGSRFMIGTCKGIYTSRDIGMTYWLERAEAERREPL